MSSLEQIGYHFETTFQDTIWKPFTEAISRYHLIAPGDHIAVCISGGKDSMLMAKLMQHYQAVSELPFELTYLIMDPGYNRENRDRVESNASLLGIPYILFESSIFDIANVQEKNPCYLCARMRRGTLYSKARELGCNKIALGHHFNDVIETTLLGMFYGSQLQAMLPKLDSTNFPGMQLIRPLYQVHEEDIIAWSRFHGLSFIQCACRFTEKAAHAEEEVNPSKRLEMKLLLRKLREEHPDIEQNIFQAIHHLELDTMPAYKSDGVLHSIQEYV